MYDLNEISTTSSLQRLLLSSMRPAVLETLQLKMNLAFPTRWKVWRRIAGR